MADQPYEILARTPFPGPTAPGSVRRQLAITFRPRGDPAGHTIWIDAEIATDEAIDAAIRRWLVERAQ